MSRGPGGRMHGGTSGVTGKSSDRLSTKEGEKAHRAKRGMLPVGSARRRVAVQRARGHHFDLRSQ